MATNADELQGSDNQEIEKAGDEGAEAEGQSGEDTGADDPLAPVAQKLGWVPKDQFTGNPEDWKPAEQFIIDGRDIQRETSRELKSVRQQLDTIARTSASLVEQTVNERVEALTAKYQKAVDDGEAGEAFKLAKEITTITAPQASTPQATPDAQAFAERNKAWFHQPGHEYATARAVAISNELQAAGYTDHATQLQIVEQRLRQEMPQLFKTGMNGKSAPGVNAPGSRTSGVSNRAKGFSDMPAEAQKIARDMADRQVIKSVDDYAKNYFANLQGKA